MDRPAKRRELGNRGVRHVEGTFTWSKAAEVVAAELARWS
jgi:hypothetical protein